MTLPNKRGKKNVIRAWAMLGKSPDEKDYSFQYHIHFDRRFALEEMEKFKESNKYTRCKFKVVPVEIYRPIPKRSRRK